MRRGEQLLEWAMNVMKVHAGRKAILEVIPQPLTTHRGLTPYSFRLDLGFTVQGSETSICTRERCLLLLLLYFRYRS